MDAGDLIESIRVIMFTAGILGNNWLAITSLPKKKSEIRTNEILLINLAVSNLITNYLVDAPDTIADFVGQWFMGITFCGIFRFCADLSETSSLFTTFFICAYWHQKLVGSLKRGNAPVQLDNLRLVGCLLAGSWTLSSVLSFPHFFFVSLEGTNESHEDCIDFFPDALSRQIYEICFLTLANVLPVAGIMVACVQIIATLLQSQKRIQSHSSNPAKMTVKENPERSTPYSSPLANKIAEVQPNLSRPSQVPSKRSPNSHSHARAAMSVVAVATVVLICWATHLLLRITNYIQTSPLMVELASHIAASYTCIIPHIFLHGAKRHRCPCKL
ncbi:rhodopsin [Cyprinodon tularosa]|uniref:rhodopsin n=1 Tax=Cyprinodon tularosa TaxID=77115 RepID=UPI0018E26FDF|nr:rhodopsin [Cyprinodon tularosa]